MPKVLILIALAMIVCGGMIGWRLFYHESTRNIVLAEDFQIMSEWKEVGTQNELQIEKDYNYISFQIEPPLEIWMDGADASKWGIKIPGGTVINPEIRIIDAEGKEYPLFFAGSRKAGADEFANYHYEGNLPINRIYQKVRLRSDSPMTVKAILWSGYDQSDRK
jgi:hypothetical protein